MVFSDSIFLFLFFPIVLFVYYGINLVSSKSIAKNLFLFIASLFFYAFGNYRYIGILLLSIGINYFAGILVGYFKNKGIRKLCLILALIINISILFHFKYQNFLLSNIQEIFHIKWELHKISLPIGISFFTFQAMSYVIDVYKKKVKVQKNPVYLGLYISFFPQLVAGPIVRYEDIEDQINTRKETFELFSQGIVRFVIGLGKKVLLANNLAVAADYVFNSTGDLALLSYWIGTISYTLQIYFDFSGYSDMAIGLGQIFGFHFAENFNYPYIGRNITDFWRRWHISLSTWFRDYVYIPLGGNRCSLWKQIRNLLIVWLLTGIWHGANWTFLFWGGAYFIILVLERFILHPEKYKGLQEVLYRIFTLLFINFEWLFFRSDTIRQGFFMIKNMFINKDLWDAGTLMLIREFGIFIGIGAIASLPVFGTYKAKVKDKIIFDVFEIVYYLALFYLSIIYIINGTYNPFIYFNF